MLSIEQAVRALVDDGVAEGSLVPGAKLPTERELVTRLSAPRSAIRRALDILEQEGLVTRHVGRGTFLSEAALRREGAPPDCGPAEIMQVRLVLEPPVAALAARVGNQSDLDRISACLYGGGAADDFEGFESWDAKLHRAIAHSAHNGLLMNIFDLMNSARALPVWGNLKRRTSTPERRRCYHTQHSEIVEALRDRDPEAAETAMRHHLRDVADNLLGHH
jgi:DNA-binding FadR family transcriptional regulator